MQTLQVLQVIIQMAWLRRVNNIRNRVDEVILNELVYV